MSNPNYVEEQRKSRGKKKLRRKAACWIPPTRAEQLEAAMKFFPKTSLMGFSRPTKWDLLDKQLENVLY
jgi:hypothetical protein